MGVLRQLRSLVWQQTVIALKSGKIYLLLRLLVKHWIQDPNIFHCLINYMIYHMSFPSVQFLFIDYNVRDVTWHKSYSQMATNQFSYNNDYISSMLNCESILLQSHVLVSLSKKINKVSDSIPSTVKEVGWLFISLILFPRCPPDISICCQCTMLQITLCSLCT